MFCLIEPIAFYYAEYVAQPQVWRGFWAAKRMLKCSSATSTRVHAPASATRTRARARDEINYDSVSTPTAQLCLFDQIVLIRCRRCRVQTLYRNRHTTKLLYEL